MNRYSRKPLPLALAAILASCAPAHANTNSGIDTGVVVAPRSIAISGTATQPARANGNGSVALGEETVAQGVASLAIGSSTPSLANGLVVTTPALAGAQALAYGSMALGSGALVAADGFLAMALGPDARAGNANSLALGSYAAALASRSTAVGSYANSTGNNAFAGGAGAIATGLNSVAIGGADQFVLPGSPAPANASGQNSVALGSGSTASAQDALATGRGAVADGTRAIAIGQGAVANGGLLGGTIALGTLAQASQSGAIALGEQAQATAPGAVAIGRFSIANAPMTVSFGSAGSERRLTNIADPVNGTDAVNLRTLNTRLAALPPPGPVGPAWDPDAVHYDPAGIATPPSVSLTSPDPIAIGQEVQIKNLADGSDPTDAVNVRQLQAAVASLPNVQPAIPGVTAADLDSRIGEVNGRIDQVEDRAYGGVALSLAMQQPVAFSENTTTAATLGAGVYQGRAAVAYTISKRVNPERSTTIVSGGLGLTSDGQVGARAGVSWNW